MYHPIVACLTCVITPRRRKCTGEVDRWGPGSLVWGQSQAQIKFSVNNAVCFDNIKYIVYLYLFIIHIFDNIE